MSKIKRFNNFSINENALNEDREWRKNVLSRWYVKNGWITDASIPDEAALLAKIEKEINPAFEAIVERYKIPVTNPVITIDKRSRGTYIELETDEITDLGVFANALKSCKMVFFSGREIEFKQVEEEFFFRPTIWSTLNLSYSSKKGGSNGMNYIFDEDAPYGGSNDMWYDILSGEFRSFTEQSKFEGA